MERKPKATDDMKEYQRQWRENHKDIMKAYMKEYMRSYYKVNKDKSDYQNSQRKLNRVQCECGCDVAKYNLEIHKKTKKHQNNMKVSLGEKNDLIN